MRIAIEFLGCYIHGIRAVRP